METVPDLYSFTFTSYCYSGLQCQLIAYEMGPKQVTLINLHLGELR